MHTIFAFDGDNYASASYFAESRGAAERAARKIIDLTEKFRPAGAYVCFGDDHSWRHRECPAYKTKKQGIGDRRRVADEMIGFLANSGLFAICRDRGMESTDGIASAIHRSQGCRVAVFSSDNILWQLIRPGVVTVCRSAKRVGKSYEMVWCTYDSMACDTGLSPLQWVDYLCLVGGDGVQGAKGIGQKRATAILSKFGSLDYAFRFVNEMPDRDQESVKELESRIDSVRSLWTLRRDCPLREIECNDQGRTMAASK